MDNSAHLHIFISLILYKSNQRYTLLFDINFDYLFLNFDSRIYFVKIKITIFIPVKSYQMA
jgi:hypothetical protein